MNKGDWWFKFDMKAWRTDTALGKCSLATKGAWIELLCAMREEGTYEVSGTVDQLARLVGCLPSEMTSAIDELERTGTAEVRRDVTECNADVTLGNVLVTLVSRKLRREVTDREQTRLRVQKHRANASVTDASHDRVRSKKKEVRSKTLTNTQETPLSPPSSRGETRARERVASSVEGTRVRADFVPTKEALDWASVHHSEVDLQIETEKFVNHFLAVAGVSAVKSDWDAAWRNWIMRAKKDYGQRQMGRKAKTHGDSTVDRLKGYQAVFDKYE